VDGAGAHAAAIHGIGDEPAPGLIQRAAIVEPRGRPERVQASALALARPCCEHTRADHRT
jgi:hypothetical protein